jgi:hypothetical protein
MQAVGMVNDHAVDCFRHRRVGGVVRGPLSNQRTEPTRQSSRAVMSPRRTAHS